VKDMRDDRESRKEFTLSLRDAVLVSLVLIFGTLAAGSIAFGWTPPGFAPPSGNVAAPLNTGAASQTKSGALTVSGTLTAGSALSVSGTSTLTGNVGIGTSSPATTLDVVGGANFKGVINVFAPGNGNYTTRLTYGGTDDGGIQAWSGGVIKISLSSNGVNYLNGGFVGIGTTDVQDRLSVGAPVSTNTPSYGNSTYLRLPVYGSAPPAGDCDSSQEIGRLAVVYDQAVVLYLCSKYTGQATGWVSVK
jgi:hypothetical protein